MSSVVPLYDMANYSPSLSHYGNDQGIPDLDEGICDIIVEGAWSLMISTPPKSTTTAVSDVDIPASPTWSDSTMSDSDSDAPASPLLLNSDDKCPPVCLFDDNPVAMLDVAAGFSRIDLGFWECEQPELDVAAHFSLQDGLRDEAQMSAWLDYVWGPCPLEMAGDMERVAKDSARTMGDSELLEPVSYGLVLVSGCPDGGSKISADGLLDGMDLGAIVNLPALQEWDGKENVTGW